MTDDSLLVRRSTEELHAMPDNPRVVRDAGFRGLVQSISEWGVIAGATCSLQPIVVNRHPEFLDVVIGGHRRWEASIEAGYGFVWTREIELDEAAMRKLNMQFNISAGEWDWDLLAIHFSNDDLAEMGFEELDWIGDEVKLYPPEMLLLESLKPHERNYRSHPDDEIQHIIKSLRQAGFYRNIVTSSDLVILAGHGVFLAAKEIGLEKVPVVRLGVKSNDPLAIKVLVSDNTVSHLAEDDDRLLTEFLKDLSEIKELPGTGYDEQMLAAFAMVTRPVSEIQDANAAAEWAGAGMPDYESAGPKVKLIISFESKESRASLAEQLKLLVTGKGLTASARWPPVESRENPGVLIFDDADP